MKKNSFIHYAFFILFFSSIINAALSKNLTCQSLDTMIANFPDGRIRSFCDDATRLCLGYKTVSNLPKTHSLYVSLHKKLLEQVDLQLKICELGILTFSPSFYQQNFEH